MVEPSHIALAGVWGGLLALERRAFLQAMFSRPLVAATGTGLLLADAGAGLWVGVVFELLHLGKASLGGAHPDHEMLPAVTAAASAAAFGHASGGPSTPAMWTLAILLFAPMGILGRVLEARLDLRAALYQTRADGLLSEGQLRSAARQNLWGMWPHFAAFGGLCAGAVHLGYLLEPLQHRVPLDLVRGLAWAYPAVASVAAAVAVHGSHARGALRLATGAAVFTAVGALLGRYWGLR